MAWCRDEGTATVGWTQLLGACWNLEFGTRNIHEIAIDRIKKAIPLNKPRFTDLFLPSLDVRYEICRIFQPHILTNQLELQHYILEVKESLPHKELKTTILRVVEYLCYPSPHAVTHSQTLAVFHPEKNERLSISPSY